MLADSILVFLGLVATGAVAIPGPEAVIQAVVRFWTPHIKPSTTRLITSQARNGGLVERQYQKVCRDWEIGVGTFEDCPNFSCTGEHATIFTSNCNNR